jgi:hypothetical protein
MSVFEEQKTMTFAQSLKTLSQIRDQAKTCQQSIESILSWAKDPYGPMGGHPPKESSWAAIRHADDAEKQIATLGKLLRQLLEPSQN